MRRLRDNRGIFIKRPEIELPSPSMSDSENSPRSTHSAHSNENLRNFDNMANNNNENAVRTLNDYLHPNRTATPSCIMFPPIAQLPEFKPGIIQLLPTFHGLENANPYVHIREFEEVVATFQNRANVLDIIKLRFFPFSLKDNAKVWLYSLRPRSKGSWDEMTQNFFQKYFPTHKTSGLRRKISNFGQKESETLYQVWERYKDLLNSCPHHSYESWRVVSYFYDGLLSRERQFIETMCNGEFLHKDPDEAINFLDDLSKKSHTWTGPNAIESTKKNQTAGIYQLKEEDSLKAHLESLTKEIEVLKTKDAKAPEPVARVEFHEPCFMCNRLDHTPRECPTYFEIKEIKEECNDLGIPFRKTYDPYSNTFNLGWKNHPNFSWRSNAQPSTQTNTQWRPEASSSNAQQSLPLEDAFKSFMQVHAKSLEEQGRINQRFLEEQQGVKEEQKVTKSQLTKLTNLLTVQEQGHFPSQPQLNPRGQHMAQTSNPDKQHVKEANVIITRSGKEIDGPTPSSNLIPKTTSNKDEAPKDQEAPSDSMPMPFPQALLKPKERNSTLKGKILEQLKQVRINLPFLHVIKQVPNYAKVIKDLCTLKRKDNVKKTTFLAEQASAVIDSKTPPKYKDLGYPTVACQIGNQACGQALLDLGASVNLMPYSIYLQLGLGEIKPTTVVLSGSFGKETKRYCGRCLSAN
ncbi:hypothetical protein UlMin_011514 [Ulmus minor]